MTEDVADPPRGRAEHAGELVGVLPLLVREFGQDPLGERIRVDRPAARHHHPPGAAPMTRHAPRPTIASAGR